MFSRIAVVNRGEPAVRLIRAVRELDAEQVTSTRVIAQHTEAERRATFVPAVEEAVLRAAFLASARGGRSRSRHEVERTLELGYRGQVYRRTVGKVSQDRYRVELDDRYVDVDVDRLGRLETRLTVGAQRASVVAVEAPGPHLVKVDSVTHRVTRYAGGVVRAPAPSVVVALRGQPGQDVGAGQTVAVLESMKMETAAPFAGRVRELLAAANSQVDAGALLLTLERAGDDAEEAAGERPVFPGNGAAEGVEQAHLRVELATRRAAVRSAKLGEVAAEFEAVHDIERARRVGSMHDIIPAAELRPRLIAAVERGMERAAPA